MTLEKSMIKPGNQFMIWSDFYIGKDFSGLSKDGEADILLTFEQKFLEELNVYPLLEIIAEDV